MKYIKSFILLVILLFSINVFADSATQFAPSVNINEKIIDNKITIELSFDGESINKISHDFVYDHSILRFESIEAINGFEVVKSNESSDGKYFSFTINASSGGDEDKLTKYAIVTFTPTSNFKVKKDGYIKLINYEASSLKEDYKYRNAGKAILLRRDTLIEIGYIIYNVEEVSNFTIWYHDNNLVLFIGIGVIILLLIIFLLMPNTFFKENREKRVVTSIGNSVNNQHIKKLDLDAEKAQAIGRKPAKEPENKLEVSEYDPFKDNVGKGERFNSNEKEEINGDVFSIPVPEEEKVEELPQFEAVEKITNIQDRTNNEGESLSIINKVDIEDSDIDTLE